MSDALLFLDVNVPMYAAGRDHGYREACIWVLGEIADGRIAAAIDTEIIQEILYRYGTLQEWEAAERMATSLLELVPVVLPVTVSEARAAVALFAEYGPQGVAARDVLHAAVMQSHGLTRIISTDGHFDRIDGVDRLDPRVMFDGDGL